MSIWVKICGLSTPTTVEAAVRAGADAVGFVLAPGGPRTVDAQTARDLAASVGDRVETVGVFRDQPTEEVLELARTAGVSTVQLHGSESPADVAAVRAAGFRVIRAVDAAAHADEGDERRAAFREDALLLDAAVPGAGATFDVAHVLAAPPRGDWLLAGGLTPANVAGRVAALRAAGARVVGVDVSSGVESSRGVKSVELIDAFVAAARR